MSTPERPFDPARFVERVRETQRHEDPAPPPDQQRRLDDCGISWGPVDVSSIRPSATDRARARFRAQLPELIWNAAALEGNHFTLPEVRTLLDGVTVGGRPTRDAAQVLALSDAYSTLDASVGSGRFELRKQVSDDLHARVAHLEAIESGHFRGEGHATGGGAVRLANGGTVPGVEHGDGGELLLAAHARLLAHLSRMADPRERALVYFAAATRRQYYFDGNKRTARLMMSGELMAHGFDAVSVPFARRLEFHLALDALFETDDATELLQFLATCAIE